MFISTYFNKHTSNDQGMTLRYDLTGFGARTIVLSRWACSSGVHSQTSLCCSSRYTTRLYFGCYHSAYMLYFVYCSEVNYNTIGDS